MKDLSTISSDLFNKIRSRFSDIKIGDESGALTNDESKARFFDVNYAAGGKDLGRVNIKIDEKSLTVIYNESMLETVSSDARNNWYGFLKELRQFARSNLLTFDTRDITKSNLDKRDYQYLAKDTGDLKMSESRLFGTSKTSFQDVGQAKIIVKHTAPVNMENPAGRTQRIESIYIESANGERFRYPHRHLNGARAMARHVANGGTAYDTIGQYISGLSEEIGKLRQFKQYTQRTGVMAEALGDITEQVAERIDSIKLEIAALQRQQYYDSFRESFEPRETEEVPEDLMNDWVDALTIKSFNEELKSVFPYIYSLVKEKTEQGLSYDDLVNEGETCADCHKDPCECDVEESTDMFDEFEQTVDELATPEFAQQVDEEPNEGNEFAEKVRMLKSQGAKPGTKFKTSDGQEHTLEDVINAAGLAVTDFWTEEELQIEAGIDPNRHPQTRDYGRGDDEEDPPFTPDPANKPPSAVAGKHGIGYSTAKHLAKQGMKQAVPEEVVEFIASMYDRDTGTFPKGEEGVKIAVEKKFGEQAAQFANFVVEKLSGKQQHPQLDDDTGELSRIRELAGMPGNDMAEGSEEHDIVNSRMPIKYIARKLQEYGLEKDIRIFLQWAIDNGSVHIEDAIELADKANIKDPEVSFGLHRLKKLVDQGVAEGSEERVKFRGTDHDIGEERYVFAVDGNPLVFNFPSDEDQPDPDSPNFEEIMAKVQRSGEVRHYRITPAEQQAIAKKIAAERQRYLGQRLAGTSEGSYFASEINDIRKLSGI